MIQQLARYVYKQYKVPAVATTDTLGKFYALNKKRFVLFSSKGEALVGYDAQIALLLQPVFY